MCSSDLMVPIENGRQVGMLAISAVSIATAVVFVGLRLVAKSMGNRIDYSDYCIVAALVSRLRCARKVFVLILEIALEYSTSCLLHVFSYTWRIWIPHRGSLRTFWT